MLINDSSFSLSISFKILFWLIEPTSGHVICAEMF